MVALRIAVSMVALRIAVSMVALRIAVFLFVLRDSLQKNQIFVRRQSVLLNYTLKSVKESASFICKLRVVEGNRNCRFSFVTTII